jgi:hypothetical protein
MKTWGHVILLYWNRWPRVLKENDRWRLEYWNKPGCHKSLDGLALVLPWPRWWPAEVIPIFLAVLALAVIGCNPKPLGPGEPPARPTPTPVAEPTQIDLATLIKSICPALAEKPDMLAATLETCGAYEQKAQALLCVGLICRGLKTPAPPATATSTSTATPRTTPSPTSSPTPVVTASPTIPAVQPPPYCFSNGGSGVGNPPFTEIKYQQHALKIDFTWWHWMGEAWRDKYACGGPNQNSKPCWSGGICSPCDPDHAAAFNGPCGGREWGPMGPGTVATFSGPGYAGETWPDDANPFADVWMRYNPGLPVHAKYCPPADMKDVASGLVIPIKGYYSASGCREVDFIAPAGN